MMRLKFVFHQDFCPKTVCEQHVTVKQPEPERLTSDIQSQA